MPDYGGDKGFGSNKDDPGKDRSTGGNKPGQGSGYNAPGPQYGGSLADTQNKLGTKYSPELAAAITASNKAAFDDRTKRDFINRMADLEASSGQKKSFGQGLKKFGQGIMSNLSPQRMLGTALGTALLGPFGGILGGLIGGTYGDDDPSNNFFGKIGSSLKKDFTDTVNFFTPQQVEQSMMTNMPMKRPMQMFPIKNVTQTTGMPGMEQIPDMFPDNLGQPTYTPEAAGFGIDSLMKETTVSPNITNDMMFRAAVSDPYVDTDFGALTFGPTVFGSEGFQSLIDKGLTPVGVSQNITPAFLKDK
jgi:hypothetical protein